MHKVKEKLHDLILKLFLDLDLTVEMSHRKVKVNAKLEATLKTKKTLNLARILEEDQASQLAVTPKSTEDVVNTLAGKQIDYQGRQKQKNS
jgi:hypothetical protein